MSGIATPPAPHPVNVRRVGESREIVKQTDFGFGAGPGGFSSSDSPFNVRSSPHDLCHGWELPSWLPHRTSMHIFQNLATFSRKICFVFEADSLKDLVFSAPREYK